MFWNAEEQVLSRVRLHPRAPHENVRICPRNYEKPRRIPQFAPGPLGFAPGFAPGLGPEISERFMEFHDLPPSPTDLFIIIKKGVGSGGKLHPRAQQLVWSCTRRMRILVGFVVPGPFL